MALPGILRSVAGPGQREVEAALVVASSQAAGVYARLRELETLGGYDLESRPTQRFHERYFDTPSHDLWRLRLALRERRVEGECLLALKGEVGPRERLEIEGHEGEATRKRIEGELRVRGIRTPLDALGVFQEYVTTRERRALISTGRTVAELALDEVRYRLDGRDVRLHEVEVELEGGDAELDPLLVDLRRAAPQLREWPYNKLATGVAIATALHRGELSPSPEGTLTWEALDQLARRLASGDG